MFDDEAKIDVSNKGSSSESYSDVKWTNTWADTCHSSDRYELNAFDKRGLVDRFLMQSLLF